MDRLFTFGDRNARPDDVHYIIIYRNNDEGMEARVQETDRGYRVSLWDLDSMQAVPVTQMFKFSMADALTRAKALARCWAFTEGVSE